MKRKKKREFPANAKVTVGNCLRGSHELKRHRNHSKYCSDLCKKHDNDDRREKGYLHLVFKGKKEKLIEFRKRKILTFLSTFSEELFRKIELDETEKIINEKGLDKSWIEEAKDFRLHHIAHNPNNPFELYYTEEGYSKWKLRQI